MANRTYIQISLYQASFPLILASFGKLAIMEFLEDWTDAVPSLGMIGKGTVRPYT